MKGASGYIGTVRNQYVGTADKSLAIVNVMHADIPMTIRRIYLSIVAMKSQLCINFVSMYTICV